MSRSPYSAGRIAGYMLLAGAALLYADRNFVAVRSGMPLPSDFEHYYEAGKRVLHGVSPYSDPAYNYPPALAFLVAPLALTSYVSARWIWFIASHAMLLAAAVLTWRFLGRGLLAACCCGLVWSGGGAAGESLALGQIGPLLTLLLAVAYTTTEMSRGIAAGIGAAIKVLPGVIVFPEALAREWRSVISTLASAALLILLPAMALVWFEGSRSPQDPSFLLGSPAILSWSVPSTLLRISDPPVSGGALPPNWMFGNQVTSLHLPQGQKALSAGSSLAVLIAGAGLLLWRTRGRIGGKHAPVAMAGLLSLALAAAPVCWSHYQVLQYPGVALMLGFAATRHHWRIAAAILFCGACLYPIPVTALAHYYHRFGWTAASPWQLYVWTSLTPAACLGLFALACCSIERAGDREVA